MEHKTALMLTQMVKFLAVVWDTKLQGNSLVMLGTISWALLEELANPLANGMALAWLAQVKGSLLYVLRVSWERINCVPFVLQWSLALPCLLRLTVF